MINIQKLLAAVKSWPWTALKFKLYILTLAVGFGMTVEKEYGLSVEHVYHSDTKQIEFCIENPKESAVFFTIKDDGGYVVTNEFLSHRRRIEKNASLASFCEGEYEILVGNSFIKDKILVTIDN